MSSILLHEDVQQLIALSESIYRPKGTATKAKSLDKSCNFKLATNYSLLYAKGLI